MDHRLTARPPFPAPRFASARDGHLLSSLARLRQAASLRARRALLFDLQSGLHSAAVELEAGAEQDLAAALPRDGAHTVLADPALGTRAAARLFAIVRRVRPDTLLIAPDVDGALRRRGGFILAHVGARGLRVVRIADAHSAMQRAAAGGRAVLLLPALVRTLGTAGTRTPRRMHPAMAALVRCVGGGVLPVHLAPTGFVLRARKAQPSGWRMRVGRVIAAPRLARFDDEGALFAYLRLRLFALCFGGRARRAGMGRELRRFIGRPAALLEPIPAPERCELLEAELEALGPAARLVEQGGLAVFLFRAHAAPRTLNEVARLREVTFRAVGEGSGRALDRDTFDDQYQHLVVWDRETRMLVGAYRLVGTDEVLARAGVEGLYTRTLFQYDRGTIESLGPALELGRSFVRAEYQRSYAPLLLLWRGIGAYLVANPRYRRVFGAVSITAQYQPLSQALMVAYLRTHRLAKDLAGQVGSERPYRFKRGVSRDLWRASQAVCDVDELSGLVSDIELDRKGVPVLLREYLKLGGQVIGFNVDTAFSDVLDALIVIDLVETPPRILSRYLGTAGLAEFLSHQGAAD